MESVSVNEETMRRRDSAYVEGTASCGVNSNNSNNNNSNNNNINNENNDNKTLKCCVNSMISTDSLSSPR